jgi:acetoin utilization protein AcuB
MVARELIENALIPLKTSSTGEDALHIMSELFIKHLPIVNNKQLLGTISEDDVMDNNIMEPLGSYGLSLEKAFVKEDDHIFEILQVMAINNLSAIPVIDKGLQYLGLITQQSIIKYFASSYSFKDPGSILVLRVAERDYHLSEIARIIELEKARILSVFLTYNEQEETILLTLKISTQDLSPILATLRRYNYEIYSSFTEEGFIDALKERYDGLMAYLNV